MRPLYYLLLLFMGSLCFFMACNKTPHPNDQLYAQVMAVHDAAMPKTADIQRLQKQLRLGLESHTTLDTLAKQQLLNNLQQLNAADEAMMDWMANFKKPADITTAEAKAYLQQEMEAITKVQQLMEQSIADGKKMVDILDNH